MYKRQFDKNLPQHRKGEADNRPKAQIELKTIDQRDLVMSFATNLSKGVNIDMVIPCHLKVTAMKLKYHAFKLRKTSKIMAAGDKDRFAKTQVRFDNLKEDLVLGVRDGKDEPWVFYPPSKLPKIGLDTEEMDETDGISIVNE